VIEFAQMTEFVDNDVVSQMRREKRYFVIKIQIPFARTAPPSRLLISDSESFPSELIHPHTKQLFGVGVKLTEML
jgi:hypothetical protein